MSQLEPKINVKELSLGDWLSLANLLGNSDKWAYYNWRDNSDLKALNISLEEWRLIAERMDYSSKWASIQFGEYCPMSESVS